MPVCLNPYALLQGWPHFLGGGQKTCLKKLGGHKNLYKDAWRAKFNLIKTHSEANEPLTYLQTLYLLHTISNAIPDLVIV